MRKFSLSIRTTFPHNDELEFRNIARHSLQGALVNRLHPAGTAAERLCDARKRPAFFVMQPQDGALFLGKLRQGLPELRFFLVAQCRLKGRRCGRNRLVKALPARVERQFPADPSLGATERLLDVPRLVVQDAKHPAKKFPARVAAKVRQAAADLDHGFLHQVRRVSFRLERRRQIVSRTGEKHARRPAQDRLKRLRRAGTSFAQPLLHRRVENWVHGSSAGGPCA